MALTAFVAFAIMIVDWASHRTVTITITSTIVQPAALNMPELIREPLVNDDGELELKTWQDPNPTRYFLGFEMQNGQQLEEGQLASGFGFNALLDREITPNNVSALQGTTVSIRHRYVSLPWAPATRIHDEMTKHFELYPKMQEIHMPPYTY